MNPSAYAEALYELARNAPDAELDRIAGNLVALLKHEGHAALLPAIVRELEKLTRERQATRELIVRVARRADADRFAPAIRADADALDAAELPVRVAVDARAIGGYEVRAGGKRIDRTYKRSLIDLYQTLISS